MNDKKIILFDLDDTLLDFKKGEANAVKAMFEKYNIPYTKENINLYRSANLKWWHILELGKASKEEILVNRFKDFFESINLFIDKSSDLSIDYKEVNKFFLDHLSHESYLIDGVIDVLKEIKKRGAKIFIISNGIKYVQDGRLAKQKELVKLIDKIYLSDDIGYVKPDTKFMEYILNDNPGINKEDMIIVGDSLTSDIKLGVNSGIETILVSNGYDKNMSDKNIKIYDKPTYIVYNLNDVLNIIFYNY